MEAKFLMSYVDVLVVYFVPNTFHTQSPVCLTSVTYFLGGNFLTDKLFFCLGKFALVTKDITIQHNATPQT